MDNKVLYEWEKWIEGMAKTRIKDNYERIKKSVDILTQDNNGILHDLDQKYQGTNSEKEKVCGYIRECNVYIKSMEKFIDRGQYFNDSAFQTLFNDLQEYFDKLCKSIDILHSIGLNTDTFRNSLFTGKED